MTLFSDGACHYSHRVRIVLAEKGITAEVVDCQEAGIPDDLAELSPYGTLPLLVDRDLVLYEPRVIMEYLDERFPHPPLLPAYPVARSESRQFICRIERDWCHLLDSINGRAGVKSGSSEKTACRKTLVDELTELGPIFAGKPWFMSEEFTLVDCCMAPILWRLPQLGIELNETDETQPLFAYMDRLFARPAFKASLSAQESAMATPRAA